MLLFEKIRVSSMLNRVEEEKPVENKPKIRSVKFNVLMNMILTSSSFIFPLMTVPYASRVLGTHGTGTVAFAQSLIGYFSLFAVMGITVYGVRECARIRDDYRQLSKTVQELLIILFCTTTVVYIIFLLAVFFVPKMRDQMTLMLIFSVGIWLSSFGIDWFYQAIEQYGYITARNIVFKFIALILMFILVRRASDYELYGLVTVIAGYGSNIVNMFRLRKLISFKKENKWNFRRHFKPMFSFTVSSISSGLYSQIDIVMLGFLGTTSMVGVYQLAFKIKNVLTTAIGSVGNVMLPRLSYFNQGGKKEEFEKLLVKNFNFIISCGLALTAICIICSKRLVLLVGGDSFLSSAIPLCIIAPVMLLSPANQMLSQQMIAIGKEKAYACINFGTLILAILLSSIFVQRLGAIGAGISVTVAELLSILVRIYTLRFFVKSILKRLELWKVFAALVLASLLSIFLLGYTEIWGSFFSLLVSVGSFVACYFGVLLITRYSFLVIFVSKEREE